MKSIWNRGKAYLPIVLLVGILAGAMIAPLMYTAARAATPIGGSRTAKAGTGGVTAGLFVTLESAGVIIDATAVTSAVVGVCEKTAAADAMTAYAPMGTQATVTSGELIAVGNLLTAGTGGKAFVLDADDASTQRIAGIALTAASGADESVTVILVPGVAEQRLALGGAVALNGDVTVAAGKDLIGAAGDGAVDLSLLTGTFKTPSGAHTIAGDVTISGAKAFTSGTGAIALNGPVTASLTLTHVSQAGTKTLAGTPVTIVFLPTTGETLTYTVPSGVDLIVLNCVGWKTAAAGVDAADQWDLQNNDGSAANIFDTEELAAIGDKAMCQFDNLDDAQNEVESGDTLDLVAGEAADDDGADGIIVVTGIFKTAD